MENPHTPENWSAAAEAYDEMVADFTSLYADDLIERLAPTNAHEVLEVAAGPGNVTVRLAPRCERVLATDYAEGMIERLRARLDHEGIDNVECAQMDGQDLDIADASFDAALSNFGLMLFDDREAGFRELRRVLLSRGPAVVSAWAGPDHFEPFEIFGAAVREVLPDLPAPPGPPPVFSLADPADFAAQMEAAGFEHVEIEQVRHDLVVESPEAVWERMRSGAPPAKLLFSRIADEEVEAVREALMALLRERFGDGPVELKAVANVAVGYAP